MTIILPPMTRQQTYKDTPAGWEDELAPGCLQVSIKRRRMSRQKSFESLSLCKAYPPAYQNTSIRHFWAIGEGEPDPLRLQTCYDLAYAAKPWNPDIQTIC